MSRATYSDSRTADRSCSSGTFWKAANGSGMSYVVPATASVRPSDRTPTTIAVTDANRTTGTRR
ncbi:MAG: hypothetical protein LC779_04360 [Actinobacteria bacterium]|nr:hypothetical protein [Actinomycetota bacterium]